MKKIHFLSFLGEARGLVTTPLLEIDSKHKDERQAIHQPFGEGATWTKV